MQLLPQVVKALQQEEQAGDSVGGQVCALLGISAIGRSELARERERGSPLCVRFTAL